MEHAHGRNALLVPKQQISEKEQCRNGKTDNNPPALWVLRQILRVLRESHCASLCMRGKIGGLAGWRVVPFELLE